jgi:nascent polypeptide-associated complex subunit alpha
MFRGGGSNREMRRMLDKMGLEMNDIGDIDEVIIKTENKEIHISKPQVVEMKGKDSTIYQIIASDIEEVERAIPSFKEEDITLVMHQSNVSKEKAIQALTDTKGDIAQAILNLTT